MRMAGARARHKVGSHYHYSGYPNVQCELILSFGVEWQVPSAASEVIHP